MVDLSPKTILGHIHINCNFCPSRLVSKIPEPVKGGKGLTKVTIVCPNCCNETYYVLEYALNGDYK